MDLTVLKLTPFLILKRRPLALSRGSIQFNGKIINMILLTSIFILRYLILLAGYSILPQNFMFKSPPSNFFWLDLKITISVIFLN